MSHPIQRFLRLSRGPAVRYFFSRKGAEILTTAASIGALVPSKPWRQHSYELEINPQRHWSRNPRSGIATPICFMNINWTYISTSLGAFALAVCGFVVELPAALATSVTNSVPVDDRLWIAIGFWAAGYATHHYAIGQKTAAQITAATTLPPVTPLVSAPLVPAPKP